MGRLLFAAFLALALCSCGAAVRVSREETRAKAAEIEAGFRAVRAAEEALAASIEATYAGSGKLDLSVDGMDAERGGQFASFQGGKFYYKTSKAGCCYYCSPMGPVTDAIRREIRLMGYFEGDLAAAHAALPDYLSVVFYGIREPTSIGVMFPWTDVVSTYPPGVSFSAFEWFRRGLASPGPSLWSAQPFADLVNGWVMDLAKPIGAEGKTKGVVVIGIRMTKASEYYLGKAKTPLLLLAADSTVMGASPSARAATGLNPLEDAAMVRQLSANSFVPASQRLDYESRPPELRELAVKALSGQSGFDLSLGGASWAVESIRIPEIGFYLVGLGRR
jgi:hypothetical protein